MTQEQKELLLKGLCARLPYGVKVNIDTQGDFTLIGLTKESVFTACEIEGWHYNFPIETIKPHLFPLSSMTEEQKKEFYDVICWETSIGFSVDENCNQDVFLEKIDWLNKNHFDYRGLIPMGLAIDATGLNIY